VPINRPRAEWLPRRRWRRSPRTPCPHCGKVTATVRGTCTECWGSKGGQLFTVEKRRPAGAGVDPVLGPSGCLWWPLLLAALSLSILLGWIWD
jgi:hypothetical protein